MRSTIPAERFAAALLIPGVLAERLRELNDFNLGQRLEDEVWSNLNLLAPEITTALLFILMVPSLSFAGAIHDDCRSDGSSLNRIFMMGYVGGVLDVLTDGHRITMPKGFVYDPVVCHAPDTLRPYRLRLAAIGFHMGRVLPRY